MAEYVKKLALDFNAEYPIQTVFAKQLDENSRFLLIEPQLDGNKFDVRNCTVKLYAERPDRQIITVDGEITDEGNIYVELSKDTVSLVGIVTCDVKLLEDDEQLSSCLFHLSVIKSIGASGTDPPSGSGHRFITVDLLKIKETFLPVTNITAIIPFTANSLSVQNQNVIIHNTLQSLTVQNITAIPQEIQIEEV